MGRRALKPPKFTRKAVRDAMTNALAHFGVRNADIDKMADAVVQLFNKCEPRKPRDDTWPTR